MTPEICPNCGAEVPDRAKACPECGSCEATGWSEAARTSGLDLPDDSFDYNEFVRTEFGLAGRRPRGQPWLWWGVALGVILILVLLFWR